MRDRQHEVLAEGVEEAEGHLVVVPAAIDRILRHVVERVVHPAHVPFEAEAEAALVGRPRNAGKRGQFLGDGDRAGKAAVDEFVGAAEEGDRVAIFVAAVGVRQPFALLCANNRGRASRRRRRRAARRCGSGRPSRARCNRGSWRPRGGRNCRSPCSSPDGSPCAGRRVRKARCRRNAPTPVASVGKCAGTQSRMTPRPAACARSTKRAKAAGSPKRRVGANRPIGW